MIMSSESETGKMRKTRGRGKTGRTRRSEKNQTGRRATAELHVRQLVRFAIDGAEFGVDVGLLREIRRATDMTTKSAGPSDVCGTISADGEIVEVIDLGVRLGYPPHPINPASRVILFSIRDKTRGALVDEVTEVLRLEEVMRDKSAPSNIPVETGLIQETIVVDERRIMVLDWPRVLG